MANGASPEEGTVPTLTKQLETHQLEAWQRQRADLVGREPTGHLPAEDPLSFFPRLLTKAHTTWLKRTYPFHEFGRGVSIHHSSEIRRSQSHKIQIEDSVLLARDVWLNVALIQDGSEPAIVIGRGSKVGRRTVISARNQIRLQENVLIAPGVFITDHNHEYGDVNEPILQQGTTLGGRIIIEQNCWLGYCCVIIATKKDLVIGRNSVIGAHSVVTQSCPPNSVVAGNPAEVVKRFDVGSGNWQRCQAIKSF
jgi:acetyltransferase-like isoleucine patch superfamily enzyme